MTMLPASSDFTGASITEGQFKTAVASMRAFLYEKLGDDGSVAIQAFAAGTRMLFHQTAAPTGWTKDTSINDKALRVVSGAVGSGGTSAFSTVFGKTATDSHTLTESQMPSHVHQQKVGNGQLAYFSTGNAAGSIDLGFFSDNTNPLNTAATGGGGGHSHNIDIRVQYVDVIIATKD